MTVEGGSDCERTVEALGCARLRLRGEFSHSTSQSLDQNVAHSECRYTAKGEQQPEEPAIAIGGASKETVVVKVEQALALKPLLQ